MPSSFMLFWLPFFLLLNSERLVLAQEVCNVTTLEVNHNDTLVTDEFYNAEKLSFSDNILAIRQRFSDNGTLYSVLDDDVGGGNGTSSSTAATAVVSVVRQIGITFDSIRDIQLAKNGTIVGVMSDTDQDNIPDLTLPDLIQIYAIHEERTIIQIGNNITGEFRSFKLDPTGSVMAVVHRGTLYQSSLQVYQLSSITTSSLSNESSSNDENGNNKDWIELGEALVVGVSPIVSLSTPLQTIRMAIADQSQRNNRGKGL